MELSKQQQYIANWHDSFVGYIRQYEALIAALIVLPEATDEDKQILDRVKLMLNGKDAHDIESDLSNATVRKSTIDKIVKLDKDIVDFAVDHMSVSPVIQRFLKQVSYYHIEFSKQAAIKQLKALQMPLYEEDSA